MAEEEVRRSVAKSKIGADVLVLDVDVAAFITPGLLRRAGPAGYDLILIPGAITADFGDVEGELQTAIRLGPKHAVDLGEVVDQVAGTDEGNRVELSKTTPACVLLADRLAEKARALLQSLEERAGCHITIKGQKVGGTSRMKVLAEIVDSTSLDEALLQARIRYYQEQGADMIDLGVPLDASPADVERTVSLARKATDLPVSVDTVIPDLILAGARAGADLILSLNGENISVVGPTLAGLEVPTVVIPGPKSSLQENMDRARTLGIDVIADPVLSPPLQGLAASLVDYLAYHRSSPQTPIFFGVGNVTELIDADSQGVNGLLAALGAEVGASILFVPEYSPKATGSVRELRTASEMMAVALERKSPPKDLGIDLLLLKEKRRRPGGEMPEEWTEAGDSSGPHREMDPAGPFRIALCGERILAVHERATIAGKSAREMLKAIIDKGLVTRLDHAGYLGRELERAELALRLGRSCAQDDQF
ncbi:MAG: dihydropteroate synthase-like protein [Methanosarcinales archaeon]|nr:dihydropteroate synthase-like protein [Methanosarcinales archaeon]